jgi:hypothetical protein
MVSYTLSKLQLSKSSASKFATVTSVVRSYGNIHFHENKVIENVHNLKEIFYSPKRQEWLWCPPNFHSMYYLGSFTGLKQPGHDVDHSPTVNVIV